MTQEEIRVWIGTWQTQERNHREDAKRFSSDGRTETSDTFEELANKAARTVRELQARLENS